MYTFQPHPQLQTSLPKEDQAFHTYRSSTKPRLADRLSFLFFCCFVFFGLHNDYASWESGGKLTKLQTMPKLSEKFPKHQTWRGTDKFSKRSVLLWHKEATQLSEVINHHSPGGVLKTRLGIHRSKARGNCTSIVSYGKELRKKKKHNTSFWQRRRC